MHDGPGLHRSATTTAAARRAIQHRQASLKTLETLKKHNVRATGFVNEMKLNTSDARDFYAGLLEDWLHNGHLLGDHGCAKLTPHWYKTSGTPESFQNLYSFLTFGLGA